MATATNRVLLLGGTSYVAQFLCKRYLDGNEKTDGEALELACTVRASSNSFEPPAGFELAGESSPSGVVAPSKQRRVRVFPGVSLLNLESVVHVIEAFQPSTIINCIAMSSPAACERDPAAAKALNEPTALISYLQDRAKTTSTPLQYIHFSTDFVYDGVAPPLRGYQEHHATASPTQCIYSATKLAFDNFLLHQPQNPNLQVIVLRIANVIGGKAPFFGENQSPKFVQWLHNELFLSPHKQDTPVKLWEDEVRSFLFIDDLVRVVWKLITCQERDAKAAEVYNVGGRDALSRVAFANKFLDYYNKIIQQQRQRLVREGDAPLTAIGHRSIEPAQRALVDMGYHSPLDARVDCAKLQKMLQQQQEDEKEGTFAFTATEVIMDKLCQEMIGLSHPSEAQ